MEMTVLVADIKVLPLYRCKRCKGGEVGDTQRESFRCTGVEDLTRHLSAMELRAAQMPVGWSSHTDGFYCPQCARDRNESWTKDRSGNEP